jgi:RNA ligase (TIGR02306 family)
MKARHKKLFKKPWAKWMMKRAWGRKVMFFFFGKKKDNPRGFPTFVSKTDEERIENVPWRLQEDKQWLTTEKLDGTSCTYALERKGKNKFEFYVCSRNVRQKDETQECYHDHNIYWDMAFKYNIEQRLTEYLNLHPELTWVCIQGEGVGSVQGNPLKLKEDDFYVFNFITSKDGRWSSTAGKLLVEDWGMKWVPMLGIVRLPETMEEMKSLADGNSMVNPEVIREGIVYRSLDGKESFKNVSNKFLLSRK